MDDRQLDELIFELSETRKSFDAANLTFQAAVSSIKWNKINTIILYTAVVLMLLMGIVGVRFYFDERKATCVEHNEIRAATVSGDMETAYAIGIALESVSGASHTEFEEYLRIVREQPIAPALQTRDC